MAQNALHDVIVERWGADIGLRRAVRPDGTVIIMDEAVSEFNASRSAIREAVRVLESLGLVASRQRVGILVQPPEAWSPYDERVLRWRLDGAFVAGVIGNLTNRLLQSPADYVDAGLLIRVGALDPKI